MGSHVPRLGETALQAICGGFNSHWLHKKMNSIMTIFKWIKNGKLYLLYKGVDNYIAIPFEHSGSTITSPNLEEFIPINTSIGSDSFV